MEKIKLSPRLETVASFVPQGSVPADIGTDHGRLPVYLIKSGRVDRAIASDVREGPLCSARITARRYGAEGRVDFILTDGLHGIEEKDFDVVIMAGMGGETIVNIMSEAPFLRDRARCLILQPQSKTELLRRYLSKNGWSTEDERLVTDAGRLYDVMMLRYTGKREVFSPAEMYAGRRLFERKDPLLSRYIDEITGKLEKKLSGLSRSETGEGAEAEELRETLRQLVKMKEEITW